MKKPLAICIVEDRKTHEPGLRVLLKSLSVWCRGVPIYLYYSPADDEFIIWLRSLRFSQLVVRDTRIPGSYGWNVKPQALLQAFDEGFEEAIWLDADLVLSNKIDGILRDLPSDVLVATEEALLFQNEVDGLRARLWGFPVARTFPFPINTAVLRVSRNHRLLLQRWKAILESHEYKESQKLDVRSRPLHMLGDQDVLTALLSSQEFSSIPVKVLRRGSGIIQFFSSAGFTVAERITCILRGMPAFVHAQGFAKPWLTEELPPAGTSRQKLDLLYQDLSPYKVVASQMCTASLWTRPRSRVSAILRQLGFNHPPMVGLPLALFFDAERLARKAAKRAAEGYFPQVMPFIRAFRYRRSFRASFRLRQQQFGRRLYQGRCPQVLSGPFAGMKYLDEIVWGPIEPKWLGTYEEELHSLVCDALTKDYETVIDIGSAEGYYAVGAAWKLPETQVYSYDTDPFARRQQRKLARINRVRNLWVGAWCTPRELEHRASNGALIICDIEGAEYTLLDPEKAPNLHKCDILVEVHGSPENGLTVRSGAEELIRRFSASHHITKVAVTPRSLLSLQEELREKFSDQELLEMLDERRSEDQLWLSLKAKRPVPQENER